MAHVAPAWRCAAIRALLAIPATAIPICSRGIAAISSAAAIGTARPLAAAIAGAATIRPTGTRAAAVAACCLGAAHVCRGRGQLSLFTCSKISTEQA